MDFRRHVRSRRRWMCVARRRPRPEWLPCAQQTPVLIGFPIHYDDVIGLALINFDGRTRAVLLQILRDFHAFVVSVSRGFRAPGCPMLSTSATAGGTHVFRTLALHKDARLILSICGQANC